jgi:VanZ family protein
VEQCVFIDGERVTCQKLPGGTFDNWDPSHLLSFGNEATGDRPWLGEIFFAAIYDRPLSGAEIQEKYAANLVARSGSANANAEFSQGLVACYLFEKVTGRTINDTSGANPSWDLHLPRMVKNFDKSYLNGRGRAMPYEIMDLFHDLAHVLAFFPAGFIIHLAMRQRFGGGWRTSAIVFIVLTGFAFVLESFQYITLSRHSEVVDFAGHNLGAALGVMADRRFGGSLRKLFPVL